MTDPDINSILRIDLLFTPNDTVYQDNTSGGQVPVDSLETTSSRQMPHLVGGQPYRSPNYTRGLVDERVSGDDQDAAAVRFPLDHQCKGQH